MVSIHAPAWGATPGRIGAQPGHQGFNPRPRVGGDFCPCAYSSSNRSRFNPRPRVGGDGGDLFSELFILGFNPRPRVGGDMPQLKRLARWLRFQSTPPRGGRRGASYIAYRMPEVSIHAPAWGATKDSGLPPRCSNGFNPRPRVGGDAANSSTSNPLNTFQSTPPRGGRRTDPFWQINYPPFQSTPPRGGRLSSVRAC